MVKRILTAYATNSGSTPEVAEAIAEELRKSGSIVDVCPIEQVRTLDQYAAVVLGGPMIIGWHRGAAGFLKKNQQELSRIPVAYFITAMSLTRTGETEVNGIPVAVDPNLPKEPGKPGRLSFRERYATVGRYVGGALSAAPRIKPVSVALFGGKLDFSRLKLPQMLFCLLIIQAQPGDRRNWPAIQEWAANLSKKFQA